MKHTGCLHFITLMNLLHLPTSVNCPQDIISHSRNERHNGKSWAASNWAGKNLLRKEVVQWDVHKQRGVPWCRQLPESIKHYEFHLKNMKTYWIRGVCELRPPVFTGGLNSTYPTISLPVSVPAAPSSSIFFRAGYSASASWTWSSADGAIFHAAPASARP